MRDREARAQRGLDLVAYHAEHRRYASDVTSVWIPSEKALDLFYLFSAPYLLSNARRLFTALPFLFLVLSNPRFERIEFVVLRECDIAQVEEGQIAPQLLSQCECLALMPITIDSSAFRFAEQLRDTPNVTLDVVGVVR
jgi:hypothetical protein